MTTAETDTSGIFDFDLESVDEDPNAFPDGKYLASIFKVEIVKMKDASKGKSIVFTYRLQEGQHKGKDIQEWKKANSFDSARDKAYLKTRLLSVGIPESRLNSLTGQDLKDLQGTMVHITKKQNGKYANVTNLVLSSEPVEGNESAGSGDPLLGGAATSTSEIGAGLL